MKPTQFDYVRPDSLDEALSALAENDDAKVLAGGQSLVPALNMRLLRPSALVDINRVPELDNVKRGSTGSLVVGARVRQSDPRLNAHLVLAAVLPHVGHTVTRNRGTVCGSIAHADTAAELPLALLACDGAAVVASARGRREISAEELFIGPYTTALARDELLVESVWPELREGDGFAFEELAQRGGDYALCMVAARVRGTELRVVIGAVAPVPTVLTVDADSPGESAAAQVEPWGSIHGSSDYFRQLVRVLVDRTVVRAKEQAA